MGEAAAGSINEGKKYLLTKFADFMKWDQVKKAVAFIFFLSVLSFSASAQAGATRKAFYAALAAGSVSMWDNQLAEIKKLKGNDMEAFEGTLLMRKSATLKVPVQKLNVFKRGHKLLESAIGKEPANAEYRFLRLMIQENAPKIVGYNKNIAEDANTVKNNFKSLPAEAQQAIVAYSKSSKVLKGLK